MRCGVDLVGLTTSTTNVVNPPRGAEERKKETVNCFTIVVFDGMDCNLLTTILVQLHAKTTTSTTTVGITYQLQLLQE